MDCQGDGSGYDPFISLNSDTLEDVNDIIQSYIKREQEECVPYPSQSLSPNCSMAGVSPTLGFGTGDFSDILNMLKEEDMASLQLFPETNAGHSSDPYGSQHSCGSTVVTQPTYGQSGGKLFDPDSPSNQLSMSPLHIQQQQPSPPGFFSNGYYNSSVVSHQPQHRLGLSGSVPGTTMGNLSPTTMGHTKQILMNAIQQLNTEQLQSLMAPVLPSSGSVNQKADHRISSHMPPRGNVVGVAAVFPQSDRVATPLIPQVQQSIPPNGGQRGKSRSSQQPISQMSPLSISVSGPPPSVSSPSPSIAAASVTSERQSAEETMDETNDDADSIDSSCFSPGPGETQPTGKRKGPRGERKTAHNLIEKRYRTSINDRIQELKVILVGSDGKMNKSGVLKKAIDYIEAITRQNQVLLKENMEMKKALAIKGGVRDVLTSSGGSDSKTAAKSSLSGSAPKRTRLMSNLTPQAMLDRSRVSLLGFMLLVLMINPFGIVLNGNNLRKGSPVGPISHGTSRTLLTAYDFADDFEPKWLDGNFRLFCIWILNLIVIGCVLARLLIYGEPITEQNSQSWTTFWRLKAQAESDLERNDVAAAVFSFSECLKVLGRPLPVTAVDQWSALLWQLLRQVLNRVVIGKWLSKQRRGGIKPFSVMQSHGHAAMIYHRLQQLHLLGYVSDSTVSGLTLSLSAVNLGEAAGKALCPARLVEIYVTAAMQMRKAAPNWNVPARYFLTRSRHACKKGDVQLPLNLSWVFQPVGHHFFVSKKFSAISNGFPMFLNDHKTVVQVNPLNELTADFKVFLLRQLTECLLFGCKSSNVQTGRFIKTINGHSYTDIVECGQLLHECCKELTLYDGCAEGTNQCLDQGTTGDEICRWWTSLVSCSINWAAGDFIQAKLKYAAVRNIPKALLTDPLAMAVGHAFCARKVLLENFESKNCDRVVWFHCCNASKTLETAAEADHSRNEQSMQAYVRIMAHQWILISLLGVWERHVKISSAYWKYSGTGELLSIYYKNLEQLKQLSKPYQQLANKALLFDIAGQMMHGANPIATGEMLNRCQAIYSDVDYVSTDFELKQLRHLKSFHNSLQSWTKAIQ